MLECYIDIHKALVDDDGDLNEFEEPYIRDGEYFCCGREIKELENGDLYCSKYVVQNIRSKHENC